ncbi:MAG: tyrosine-type recombinase/integrase [Polyangiales bacterium]
MRDSITSFLVSITAKRSVRTIETYRALLLPFAAFLTERGVVVPGRADVEAFLARPRRDGTRRAVTTQNQTLAAVRVFGDWMVSESRWPRNPTDGIAFLREPDRDPAVLDSSEVRALFDAVGATDGPLRLRNLAMLGILASIGLRVTELVRLNDEQIDEASGLLVRVEGKNDSRHDLPLSTRAMELLRAWRRERAAFVDPGERALFVTTSGRRVRARDVQRLLVKCRTSIGTAKQITPHTLRHSVATIALTMGVDLSTVGELLRHSSLDTTRQYLHLIDTRRRDAVTRLEVAIPRDLLRDGDASPKSGPTERADAANPRPNATRTIVVDDEGHFGDAA